jgi:hypothetical protein
MLRLTISADLRGEAAEPAGEPPQTEPRASSVSVEAVAADGSKFAIDRMAYENHAIFTGESTFTESGTIVTSGPDGELDIVTVGEGTLGPSADAELLHGTVMYTIVEGRGRFEGATGLITSNFLLEPARGQYVEKQVTIVFLP